MSRNLVNYDGDKAQSQRDAMRTPEFTLRDALNVFRAFARDFKNFDPDQIEDSQNHKDSEEVRSLCSDESDSSSESSDSSLDETALLYAELEDIESEFELEDIESEFELEDIESEFDESDLLDVAQFNETSQANLNDDSVIEETTTTVDPAIDETVSLKEESVSSSKALAFSPEIPSPVSSEFSRTVDYPLTFILHKGKNGKIKRLETQSGRAPYLYDIKLKPNQYIYPQSLRFIVEVLKQEQVSATLLSEYFSTLVISQYKYKTPRWLPAVLRHAAHEAVHDYTFRLLDKYLRNSGTFENMKWPGNLAFDIRKMLDEFYLLANSMESPELRLFASMNNMAVLPDVQEMVFPSDIQVYLTREDDKLCRLLQDETIESFVQEALIRLPVIGGLPVEEDIFPDVWEDRQSGTGR